MRFVLATFNPDKARELAAIFARAGIELVTLDAFPGAVSPEETGTTLEENARIKAEAAMRHSGLPAIADDTGLEVDALDGQIGGEVQNGLYATITRIFTDASRLYLQTGSAGATPGDMATEIERLKTAIKTLSPASAKYRRELGIMEIDGVPSALLEELDTLSLLVYVPEIMRIAESAGTTLARAASAPRFR